MGAQHHEWPKVGENVWVVYHHHTWDAHLNNTYHPVKRKVLSVGHSTVHLEEHPDLPLKECFPTEEECEAACPAAHMDD